MRHACSPASLLGPLTIFAALLAPATAHASGVPVNVTPPSVSGTPLSGQTLTASPGAWTEEPTEFRYGACSWDREESPENQSYVVLPGDVGNMLRLRVTAGNAAGASDAVTSAPIEIERSWKFVSGPPKVMATAWRVGLLSRSASGRSLTIEVPSGYCLGEPPPVIDRLRVTERPKTARRPFGSAVITAFLRFPAPTEVVGTVNEGEPIPACAGLGYLLRRRIKLKRSISDLFVFDGSSSPPRRVLRPPPLRPG